MTIASENDLSAASVDKYHTMLRSVFEHALVDRVVTFNPCAHPQFPKRVKKTTLTLTPAEYGAILVAVPDKHRLLIQPASRLPTKMVDRGGPVEASGPPRGGTHSGDIARPPSRYRRT